MDRPLTLFETRAQICYCVPNGASACAPCRERRTKNDDRIIEAISKLPYLTQTGPCQVQAKADLMAANARKLWEETCKKYKGVDNTFPPADVKFVNWTQVFKESYELPPLKPKVRPNPARARLIAEHCNITPGRYHLLVYDARTANKGFWEKSGDFPGLEYWQSRRAGPHPNHCLYREQTDNDTRAPFTLSPAWDKEQCDSERCGTHGKSTPSGQPYDPCSYCASRAFHPDTVETS